MFILFESSMKVVWRLTPASFIWTYHDIVPDKTTYTVWDEVKPLSILSSRVNAPILWNDFIRCAGDNPPGSRKNAIYLGKLQKWYHQEKGWTFWNTDVSSPYKLVATGTGCYIQSEQEVEFLGITKRQTFISQTFDIVWESE